LTANLFDRPDVVGAGAAILVGGGLALAWWVASFWAWLLRIVADDVKADFLTETDDPATETDDEWSAEPSPSLPPVRRRHARRR